MPKTILIISDMEFNSCTSSRTNFEAIRDQNKENVYECQQLVFWNVNRRKKNVPITKNDKGVALLSGASPRVIKPVLTNNIIPLRVMQDTIGVVRSAGIK